ncbi:hypothetical protein BT67DRAFT_444309 [Trichocladium antarcticum]|uniref:Uncharacterized protein n=1 Tax=Trichocladium antarcticum TaxID=1450529 RepID=A0AAN6UF80_9PEZI|nr:hypothetical protein BT67DRAFT_444309 [Trichocladium antarcticum]
MYNSGLRDGKVRGCLPSLGCFGLLVGSIRLDRLLVGVCLILSLCFPHNAPFSSHALPVSKEKLSTLIKRNLTAAGGYFAHT